MGRNKIDRVYSFKPKHKEFVAKSSNEDGVIYLSHDEIEAIFLMDYQNLYQEDSAKKMNVSRPTFSRILKDARNKIAISLITGATLKIADEKDEYVVAVFVNNKTNYDSFTYQDRLIAIIKIKNSTILSIDYYDNPIINTNEKPSIVLSDFFVKNNTNIIITSKIGVGLKNSLLSKGIFVIKTDKVINLNKICDFVNQETED